MSTPEINNTVTAMRVSCERVRGLSLSVLPCPSGFSRVLKSMMTWLWERICRLWSLTMRKILKFKTMFKLKVTAITTEATGEKNSSFFTLTALHITLNRNHEPQKITTVFMTRFFVARVMYLYGKTIAKYLSQHTRVNIKIDSPRLKISVYKYDIKAMQEKSNLNLLTMYTMNEGCTTAPTRMSVVASENIRRFELVWRLGNFRITARTRPFPATAIGDKRPFVTHTPIKML